MSEKKKREYPYKTLGSWLKRMREKRRVSLAEVSGAVEIETDMLSDMEKGLKRPSEDILILLISYFSVKETDAVKVWEMAGYTKPEETVQKVPEEPAQPVLVMPMDARIVYTDMANITANQFGLTINFLQSDGVGDKPLAVSRVGMSREHALKLLNILEKSLRAGEQKLLPAPESNKDENKKT